MLGCHLQLQQGLLLVFICDDPQAQRKHTAQISNKVFLKSFVI
jgi:hypothetical protein